GAAGGHRRPADAQGLSPAEVAASLSTRRMGQVSRHRVQTESTNREAERWALEGAPEGALVIAEHQTGGRGRMNRTWFDLPGRSLLLSLVLRPPVPAARAPAITFVAAVALAEAASRWVARERIEIKWPNDVLVGGRKLAGILLEMRCEGQRVEHVILGVGVNVGGGPGELPADVQHLATTLASHAEPAPRRLEVLAAFLGRFEQAYDEFLDQGFPAVQARWNEWFRLAGQWLRVQTPTGMMEGRALGLGPTGSLVLVGSDGAASEVFAGDVERSSTRRP
ncbi:MAG: biotin--[acetyl-CoA-carboxylase] ligase, partial [Deferrisomatales bacterium]